LSWGNPFVSGARAITRFLLPLGTLVVSANAQEALQTAIRGDALYAARQTAAGIPYRPDQLHWGPVYFDVSVSYGLEWLDNVSYESENADSDLIHRPMLDVGASWQVSETSRLSFGLGVGYQHYRDHSELDQLVLTPDSELAWDIKLQDVVLTIYDGVTCSQDVVSQGGLSGTAEFPRIENTAGVRMRWYPGRYVYQLGYAHYNFFSQGDDYDYLTRHAEQFFGRAGIRVGEVSELGLEASGEITDYDSATRADNNNFSIGPYVTWKVTETLDLSVRGGYTKYTTDFDPLTGRADDFDSYYYGLEVNHQLTEFVSHRLSANRGVDQGINQGSTLTETLNVNYSISWAFRNRWSVSGNTFYEHGREPQFGIVEEYDRAGFGAGLSWQVAEHASLAIGYQFTKKDSNFPDRDYQANSATLSASYHF